VELNIETKTMATVNLIHFYWNHSMIKQKTIKCIIEICAVQVYILRSENRTVLSGIELRSR